MAWSSPITAVTGNVHTAAQFNTNWRDNLLVTEAGIASTVGNLLVATGAHVFAQRAPGVVYAGDFNSTASTSYVDFGDTDLVVQCGEWALVSMGAQQQNDTAGLGSYSAVDIQGATTVGASATYAMYSESGNANDSLQATFTVIIYPLNPGLHIFSLNHRTTAGGGTSTFGHRLLAVVPF